MNDKRRTNRKPGRKPLDKNGLVALQVSVTMDRFDEIHRWKLLRPYTKYMSMSGFLRVLLDEAISGMRVRNTGVWWRPIDPRKLG